MEFPLALSSAAFTLVFHTAFPPHGIPFCQNTLLCAYCVTLASICPQHASDKHSHQQWDPGLVHKAKLFKPESLNSPPTLVAWFSEAPAAPIEVRLGRAEAAGCRYLKFSHLPTECHPYSTHPEQHFCSPQPAHRATPAALRAYHQLCLCLGSTRS